HYKPEQFQQWIDRVEDRGAGLWNPARVVRCNADKIYLRELQEKGVTIPETIWLESQTQADLQSVLEKQGWQKAVVKPRISATSFRSWVTSPEHAGNQQSAFDELLAASGAVVQRFVDEVQTRGEWSLMFFGGKYSHAVLKQPKAGDFRVQEEYGGSAEL